MASHLVFSIVWFCLAAVNVGAKWACDCEKAIVSCSVYDFAEVMMETMDVTLPNGNLLISPFSLWVALLYVVYATEGETKNQLSLELYQREQHCDAAQLILNYFQSATGYSSKQFSEDTGPFFIHTCTFISSKGSSTINNAYVTFMKSKVPYAANQVVDFENDGLTVVRNYKNIIYEHKKTFMQVGDITGETVYVILNMLKFNVQWKIPFSKSKEFPHKNKHYTMMNTSGEFRNAYDRSLDTNYLYLETQTDDLMMVIALTDSNRRRPNPRWDMYEPMGKPKYQHISIPKFKFEVEYSLKQVIDDLKIGKIFDSDFEIKKINGVSSRVSQVVQRTVISIDKYGVQFEAYTALVGDPSGSPRKQFYRKQPFIKPFMFYLFAYKNLIAQGRVMDPTY